MAHLGENDPYVPCWASVPKATADRTADVELTAEPVDQSSPHVHDWFFLSFAVTLIVIGLFEVVRDLL